MSFTLRAVTVYSLSGACKTIRFRKYGLNILTGQARTGKSSIIDILDYCFGRSECYVAEGVIREHVSWFGVEIENRNDVMFIGRRNPKQGYRTSSDIYIRRGERPQLPAYSDLHKNITEEDLVRLLTRFAGIAENEHRPLIGTRGPLQATIRHALFLCFQSQDEIASRQRLFHRQGDEAIPRTIKDTIPYFLGAVDDDHFYFQNELDESRVALRQLEARRDGIQTESSRSHGRIRRLLLDARRIGLLAEDFEPTSNDHAIDVLVDVLKVDLQSPTIVSGARDVIVRLENELGALHAQLRDVQNDVRTTRHFLREQTGYTSEVSEQRARLSSLGPIHWNK